MTVSSRKDIEILKDIFGFDKYLPNQEKIILSILDNKNVLTVMPTGSGKSFLYKLPASKY